MRDGTQRFEVAVDGGKIVGSCGAVISYSEILDEHVGRLFDVFVEPPYRNAGVAGELVRRSLSWLRERGCARATLRASDAGKPVYRRFGFDDVAEMELRL
jgi:GNAT superfamily N-acetyltransferase